VVAVEWGEGVAERLAARHLLVQLDRRPDDVRIAHVHRVVPGPADGVTDDGVSDDGVSDDGGPPPASGRPAQPASGSR
jgi:hypothetical protein